MMDVCERAQKYLELAVNADGVEVTWADLVEASVSEGPWLAQKLLEALDVLDAIAHAEDKPTAIFWVKKKARQFLEGGDE